MTAPVQPIVELLELPARGLTRDVVLRAFDTLRRRLAIRSTGTEGAAVGFVDLDLEVLPTEMTGHVVVRATALETGEHWQRVRYEAALQESPEVDGLVVERTVGRAIGQTVALTADPLVVPSPRATTSTARVA
jgi:hypothetical protein